MRGKIIEKRTGIVTNPCIWRYRKFAFLPVKVFLGHNQYQWVWLETYAQCYLLETFYRYEEAWISRKKLSERGFESRKHQGCEVIRDDYATVS